MADEKNKLQGNETPEVEKNKALGNETPEAEKKQLPVLTGPAASVGKLANGHTATKYRLKGGREIDLNTISVEEAKKLAEDDSVTFFVKK